MSITRTRRIPTQGPQHFTIDCTDDNGNRISVRVSYTVIDRLGAPDTGIYRDRMARHIDEIMTAARTAYDAGKLTDRMIVLSPEDFGI
jgi:hypothetical protein